MPNILLGQSHTTGKSPDTLSAGEVAINTFDKKIWVGNGSGNTCVFDASLYSTDLTDDNDNFYITGLGFSNGTLTATVNGADDPTVDLDGRYSLSGHTHNYAASNHTHNYAASNHTHNYAAASHSHDSDYYTESETDTLLGGKSDTGHTHSYAATNHTHNYAATNHTHSYAATNHSHDDDYYTESETDSLLDAKSDTGHTHSYAATNHTHNYAATNHTHNYAAATHTHAYLPTTGGAITQDTDALLIKTSTNGAGADIAFSDHQSGSYSQKGRINFFHSDAQSYGSGSAFILNSTEATTTILADGKLMYKEGIYSKPSTGTGAGTRKDANWDTAYGWGDHASGGYAASSHTHSAYVTNTELSNELDALIDAAPNALNTLNELAAAIGDDADYATTVTNALAAKADTGHTHSYAATNHSHGDLYYTETEVDSLLDAKSDTGHTHSYAATNHTHNYAASNHTHNYAASSHSHDSDYYTESEMDTLLGGKSDTGHTHSYAATNHTHGDIYYTETEVNNALGFKMPYTGGTFSGTVTVDAMMSVNEDIHLGTGTGEQARLLIRKTDNNVSDHVCFYNGTTRMGEIGCHDTTWLRINQTTNKNIYTPRYIRADGGYFVDGTSKGINGSGNFIGGTITGASDANVSQWDTAYGWGNHASGGYASSSHSHSYAATNHSHDDLYYTESEVDTLIALRASMWHNHSGTYNETIGVDTDVDTSGATVIDNIYMTDGVITAHGTRTLTLADLGYTGATNATYNAAYTAGTGMSLAGSVFSCTVLNTWRSVSDSVASSSSSVAASSKAVKSAYDRSWPNTTYTAGTGMSLAGTTFSCTVTNTDTTTWNGMQNVSALTALP